MAFPLGRPMLLLIAVALLSGFGMSRRQSAPITSLTLWTFSDDSAAVDRDLLSGSNVSIESMSDRTENLRLQSLFLDPPTDRSVMPDIVEIEIGQLGRFFRPPTADVGLLPLNDLLATDGLREQFLPARLNAWSKDGVIFGLPLDVHPVALAYRADLFSQAGIDLADAMTWPKFQAACLQYQTYWRDHGRSDRVAMELSRSTSDALSILLLQQRLDLIDRNEKPQINAQRSVNTLAFYAQLVAGSNRIGVDPGPLAAETRDIADGRIAAFLMPDWRVNEFETRFPQLRGQLRLMPLPKFADADAPTASWGGTMLGIPRASIRPQQAWAAIRTLLTSPAAIAARDRRQILSAIPSQWPTDSRPDEYFRGQDVTAVFVSLAKQMPSPAITPQTVLARAELSVALSAAVAELDHGGAANLQATCQQWLDWAQHDLTARLDHERFAS